MVFANRISGSILTLAVVAATALPVIAHDETPADAEFPRMSLDQDPKPAAPPAKEEPKLPWRTFELLTGVTYSSITSTLTMSRSGGSGSLAIDAEGVLGLSREHLSPEILTSFRFADRHRIDFSFEDMTRSATRTLERDIEIDGKPINIGTTVHSVYGVQFYCLEYAWSFLQDDRIEMAVTFAFDTLRAHFSVDASNTQVAEDQRFIFPIPLPGVDADFVLIPDLWLRERLQLMYVPVDHYSGLVINFNLALEYSILKHLSLGLGFDLLRIELEKKSSGSAWGSFEGDFKVNSAGVLFYINFHL